MFTLAELDLIAHALYALSLVSLNPELAPLGTKVNMVRYVLEIAQDAAEMRQAKLEDGDV